MLLYLSSKSSDVSLWLEQILVFSRFENAGIGAKLRCSQNFFIMVRVHKNKTITNRENLMIVLLAHFQIIVDVIEYNAPARTFVMKGTELCASVFVAQFVPDMLGLYISKSSYT